VFVSASCFDLGFINRSYSSVRGAALELVAKIGHCGGRALSHSFDSAIGQIPDRSYHSTPGGCAYGKIPVAYSLDSAPDDEPSRDTHINIDITISSTPETRP
jgi:hypothetical protein